MQSNGRDRESMGDYASEQVERGSRSAFPRLENNARIQRAIEDGEINRSDIELLDRAQRFAGIGQSLGFLVGSAGAFYTVRRRRPNSSMGGRVAALFFGGMLGSFVGFISGSVAAASEVKSKMPDANRKLAKIAEITKEAREERRAEMRQQMGGRQLPPPVPGNTSPGQIPRSFPPQNQGQGQRPYPDSSASPSSPYIPRTTPTDGSWSQASTYTSSEDAENRREQAGEVDRQRNFQAEARQIERDSEMAPLSSPYDRDPPPSDSGYSSTSGSPTSRPQQTGSAWDRLRQRGNQAAGRGSVRVQEGPGEAYDSGAGGSGDDKARSAEQREFDEMLERERRGEGETESWK